MAEEACASVPMREKTLAKHAHTNESAAASRRQVRGMFGKPVVQRSTGLPPFLAFSRFVAFESVTICPFLRQQMPTKKKVSFKELFPGFKQLEHHCVLTFEPGSCF